MSTEPKFTIQLTPPNAVRLCIRCAQPISFAYEEYPIVDNRRSMNVIAVFSVHPTTAECDAELARVRRLDHGEVPSAHDIGLQRAALLRALALEAKATLDAQRDAQTETQTPGKRKPRRATAPYGGLI